MFTSTAIDKHNSTFGDRRSCPREPLKWVVLVFFEQNNWGKLINLSEKGMSIEFAQPPALHEPTQFTFEAMGCMPLPPGRKIFNEAIQAAGQVKWVREFERTAGVEFLELPKKSREQIRHWISPITRQETVSSSSEWTSEDAQEAQSPAIEEAPSTSAMPETFVSSAEAPNGATEAAPHAELRSSDFETELVQVPEPASAPQSLEVLDFEPDGGPQVGEQQIHPAGSETSRRWGRTGIIAALVSLAVLGVAAEMRRNTSKLTGAPPARESSGNVSEGQTNTSRATDRTMAENLRPFTVEVMDAENRRWILWFADDAHQAASTRAGRNIVLTGASLTSKNNALAKEELAQPNRELKHLGANASIVHPQKTYTSPTDSGLPPAPAIAEETPATLEAPSENIGALSPVPAPVERNVPVGGDVQPARLIRATRPSYPQMARESRVEGDVTLDALIDAGGIPRDVTAISGPVLLREAAKEAVRQWRYEPTRLDGKPTAIHLTVTVRFRIN